MNSLNISYDLTKLITSKEDWHNASELMEKLYLYGTGNSRKSIFIGIGCKTLLTTAILLAAQTEYPDLLCAKAFIELPDLKDRIAFAKTQGRLDSFGNIVSNQLKTFIIFPPEPELRDSVVVEPILVLDKYFRDLASDRAICEDLEARDLYLQQLFPAPVRSKSNAG